MPPVGRNREKKTSMGEEGEGRGREKKNKKPTPLLFVTRRRRDGTLVKETEIPGDKDKSDSDRDNIIIRDTGNVSNQRLSIKLYAFLHTRGGRTPLPPTRVCVLVLVCVNVRICLLKL